ncbi:DUF4365 domain-containing protein [Streptomyces antimicrobicus]|uniref:DUF4365 domain-containing protein n=1 Tax=Streptomyces antimicrobicus TaxID=2883108 RepID=A0ABS8AZJ4_9ACTN|nr:DUF4365 domain-containing protein [Streptomyces antimicrobicus]
MSRGGVRGRWQAGVEGDLFVTFADAGRVTNDVVKVQVKGGTSGRRSYGYGVPVRQHAETAANGDVPVFCVVFDPDTRQLCWVYATQQLRRGEHEGRRPRIIRLPGDAVPDGGGDLQRVRGTAHLPAAPRSPGRGACREGGPQWLRGGAGWRWWTVRGKGRGLGGSGPWAGFAGVPTIRATEGTARPRHRPAACQARAGIDGGRDGGGADARAGSDGTTVDLRRAYGLPGAARGRAGLRPARARRGVAGGPPR